MNLRIKLLLSLLLITPLFTAACGEPIKDPSLKNKPCTTSADCKTPNTACVKTNSTSKCIPTCKSEAQCQDPKLPECTAQVTTIDGTFAHVCAPKSTAPPYERSCQSDADCKDPKLVCLKYSPHKQICAQKCSSANDCTDPALPSCVIPDPHVSFTSGQKSPVCSPPHTVLSQGLCNQTIDCSDKPLPYDKKLHLSCLKYHYNPENFEYKYTDYYHSHPPVDYRCASTCESDSDCREASACLTTYSATTSEKTHPKRCLFKNVVPFRNNFPTDNDLDLDVYCDNSEQCKGYNPDNPRKGYLCLPHLGTQNASAPYYSCLKSCETDADCGSSGLSCYNMNKDEISGKIKDVKVCWPKVQFCNQSSDCGANHKCQSVDSVQPGKKVGVCASTDITHCPEPTPPVRGFGVTEYNSTAYFPTFQACDMSGPAYTVP